MINEVLSSHGPIIGYPLKPVNRLADKYFGHDFDMETMGTRLRKVRKARKWRQTMMAKETGVPQGTISEIESKGSDDVRVGTVLKLCKRLNLNPWWLVYGHLPQNPFEGDLSEEAVEVARNWMRGKSITEKPEQPATEPIPEIVKRKRQRPMPTTVEDRT